MLRTLFKSDLEQILAIENAVHVAPWTAETFKTCFESGYLGWVVEIDKNLVGFIIVSLSGDEYHVLNICVIHAHQHQGLGSKLMEHALAYAKKEHIGIAYLEVRRSNAKAIALYKKLFFQQIGERKDYYPIGNGHEDALIFAKSISPILKE